MPFEFVPVKDSEKAVLTKFLVNSYSADPAAVSFRPDVLDWKYFMPHPDWQGPRSWAAREGTEIVAHGGIWPVPLRSRDREVSGINHIDWAASRSAVGAGVYLLRKMAPLADVLLSIGGSPETRTLLPKLGYKQSGALRYYARVVRPWAHLRSTPQKNWKSPLKFLRDSARILSGMPVPPTGWRTEKVESFTKVLGSDGLGEAVEFIRPRRTPASLDQLLKCPAAQFSGFLAREGETIRGFFLLARVGHQARIADIRLQDPNPDSWQAICSLAARTAAEDAEICEVAVGSSVPSVQNVWLEAGFVLRQSHPIFYYDPGKLIPSGPPLDLTLADGDHCLLTDPKRPYLL
jgi:hypothetical protein